MNLGYIGNRIEKDYYKIYVIYLQMVSTHYL